MALIRCGLASKVVTIARAETRPHRYASAGGVVLALPRRFPVARPFAVLNS
jgi:hypothetical protein